MIVLLHGAPAYGAVERYVAAIARVLGAHGLLIHPGVPELEALGTPTQVLGDPSLATLVRVLEEPGLAEELRRRGLERAAEFTWDRTAEAFERLLAEVAAR